MKKNVERFMFVMLAILVMLPTGWVSARSTNSTRSTSLPLANNIPSDETSTCSWDLFNTPDMVIDPDDPDAPCFAESSVVIEEYVTTPNSIQATITCGLNYKNKLRTKIVAQLGETVTINWNQYGYNFTAKRYLMTTTGYTFTGLSLDLF